jgi:hypothetical protein
VTLGLRVRTKMDVRWSVCDSLSRRSHATGVPPAAECSRNHDYRFVLLLADSRHCLRCGDDDIRRFIRRRVRK